jgi:hypothetical protein
MKINCIGLVLIFNEPLYTISAKENYDMNVHLLQAILALLGPGSAP